MITKIQNLFLGKIVLFTFSFLLLILLVVSTQSRADATKNPTNIYKTNQVFLRENFAGKVPAIKAVWLRGDLKKQVNTILAHPYGKLRVKYWLSGQKSAWILEEIGKEKPITAGIIINNNKINKVEILAFRESRGWEIKYPFFLKQFFNAGLKGNNRLDRNIDGITGATLSVRAVNKLSRIALLLHKHVTQGTQATRTASK
jgi:hypothetical protein